LTKNELESIKKFHGHVGPWVLTGFILGGLAKKYFKPLQRIIVRNPLRPPFSCLIDGVQIGSNLTIGRGEVQLIKDKKIELIFFGGKKKIRIRFNQEFKNKLMGHKKIVNKKLIEYIGNTFIIFFK
jgi:formylmethanofuran dehydrogenase subunit E